MYKIHAKLVFLKKKLTKKKLNTLKKIIKINAVQVNSARNCTVY